MSETITREAVAEVPPDLVAPRLLDLWLRVALVRSYGPPVSVPLPEALRWLVDGA